MTIRKLSSRFSFHLALCAGLLIVLAIFFVLHVRSQRQISRAHELRYESYLLADELRQSSDDLTRMVRTYVATGDPVYKQQFQDILDIRNGVKPRPEDYGRIYWDLRLRGGEPPRPETAQKISLVDLMRQKGFVPEEFRKLEEAKAKSDELTTLEFEAMKLVESDGPDIEAKRARAALMLTDETYLRAKAGIMRPIDEFYMLLDRRTQAAVLSAETTASLLNYAAVVVGLGLCVVLGLTYRTMRGILGGSLDEIHSDIARIGSGDFSEPSPHTIAPSNSVMEWLSRTRIRLNEISRERTRVNAELRRMVEVFDQSFDAVLVWDWNGSITFWSSEAERLYGIPKSEALGQVSHDLLKTQHPQGVQGFLQELERKGQWAAELVHATRDGRQIVVETRMRLVKRETGSYVIETNRDITEWKKSDQALANLKMRLERILNSVGDGIHGLDREGRIIFENPASTRMLGWELEEILGRPAHFTIHHTRPNGSEFPVDKCSIYKSLQTGDEYRVDNEVFWRKDGSCFPVEYVSTPMRDPTGAVTGAVVIFRDITERKRTEAENRRLAAIVESTDDAVIGKSLDGIITSWNSAAERIFGYTATEAIGRSMVEMFPRESAEGEAEILAKIRRGERVETFETSRLRKDGSLVHVAVTVSPVKDAEGQVVGASRFARDITKRKQAEAERDRFFTLSLDPLCIANTDGYFRRLNPAFERILGFSVDEMLRRPFTDFIHPEDLPATAKVVESLAAGAKLVDFENRYLCKDGSYR